TRTFTVTGDSPCVASDANASRLKASLIETPTQTAWISGFTSSSVVTVTLTDSAFVNVSNVSLDAIYYYLFDNTTSDITGSTPALYQVTTVQPAFIGLNDTDRLVLALFAVTDAGVSRNITLYYGGTRNFTHFDSPIATLHNDLAGLNVGDYKHLTATEYTFFDSLYNGNSVFAGDMNIGAKTKIKQDGNILMTSPNGAVWNCGVTNAGIFSCS
ncbi:MAG: hypothetical protein WC652_02885, partial [archaeon]